MRFVKHAVSAHYLVLDYMDMSPLYNAVDFNLSCLILSKVQYIYLIHPLRLISPNTYTAMYWFYQCGFLRLVII